MGTEARGARASVRQGLGGRPRGRPRAWPGAGAMALLLCLASCGPTSLLEIELVGSVFGPPGERHLTAHHAEEGEGSTAHPLGPVHEAVLPDEALLLRFDYPLDEGTGLVLHAWIDLDGDGVFCGLGADPEPAGLVELAPPGDTPEATYEVQLTAEHDCAGPETLYPPGDGP